MQVRSDERAEGERATDRMAWLLFSSDPNVATAMEDDEPAKNGKPKGKQAKVPTDSK